MVLGAGEFTVSTHRPVINGRDTIPIEVWTYPEDSAFADSVPFRRATEIVEVMQRLIGPFPYEKLAHVQSSTKFGGMENSSAIFYAEKPYIERRMGEGVVRHETAHQWFGDAVTERDWPHLWLSEGFATYFDGVIAAALDGDSTLARHMKKSAEDYFASDVTDRPIVDSGFAADPIKLLNANSYPKGAWVLHMLRGLMGDSAFFRGLRTYYRTYGDSTATSEDFQHVMDKAAKADFGWFFHQWLYQPGYPQLDVTWRYDAGAGRVDVGITQRQKPEWGLFRLPALTLEFRGADGATMRRDVVVTGADGETSDGVAENAVTVASGLRGPFGIAFRADTMYVAEESDVKRFDPAGAAPVTIVPNVPGGGHSTRTILFGPDGKLYLAVGSSCNLCDERDSLRAAVTQFNANGLGGRIFAKGLRNTVGLAFNPTTGELWGGNNDRDNLGDDLPPEHINIIKDGRDYGWPACYLPGKPNPEYGSADCSRVEPPTITIQAHSAPLGLAFYTGAEFPRDHRRDAFVTLHGSWNRSVPTGAKVVRVEVDSSGRRAAGG